MYINQFIKLYYIELNFILNQKEIYIYIYNQNNLEKMRFFDNKLHLPELKIL